MYRPLPKELTIKKSYIEGLGLFANEHLATELTVDRLMAHLLAGGSI